ncbi:MAG: FAD-dependent tricarballylate dehydrogenase TcuA [Desulfobacterales bacterium]|nr:FAD-dependent tricarballylate dehydrogenase TcuA [Desulfobacterales bacterium]
MDKPESHATDVLVVGGGNAALCAAITAREAGARVILVESAPREFRGGDSRHTRVIRCLHEAENDHVIGSYGEDEFRHDLFSATGSRANERLARLTIRQSATLEKWMMDHGVMFQPPTRVTFPLARTCAFFLGGGKAMINSYYAAALRLGVEVWYEAEVRDLELRSGTFVCASFLRAERPGSIRAKSVVLAAGGYQANRQWLKALWGNGADNIIFRGSPYNQGRVLEVLYDQGARPVGDPRGYRAVATDARSPRYDSGLVTRIDSIPLGIVVNRHARRFYDEGEDRQSKPYAIWGCLAAEQLGQIAFSIIDAKSIDLIKPSVYPPVQAGTIRQLAGRLELDPDVLEETVARFNQSTRPGPFDADHADQCTTAGLDPPKSHWARPLDKPPYYGYPFRPGITLNYMGVAVDERARIILGNGRPATNIFAAGAIMAGNVMGDGDLAGFGMTIGTVFGRIAGMEAAGHAND